MTRDYICVKPAHLVPPLRDKIWKSSTGVFNDSFAFLSESRTRRSGKLEGQIGELAHRPEKIVPGRHLYGGQLNHHFGHFICESIARFWALDHLDAPVESILLMPRRSGSPRELRGFHINMFSSLNLPVPVCVVDEPITVDELIIPEQGFGAGRDTIGSPKFRAYMRDNFMADVQPDGPERLYISRDGLGIDAGAILGESTISSNLVKLGYEHFQPEKHDLRTQIARYKAAKKIISVEGSALHLFGFVGQPHQEVAIIARRSDHFAAQSIANQLLSFCGISAPIIDVIEREWDVRDTAIRSSKSVSLINIKNLGRALTEGGFTEPWRWTAPPVNIERRVKRIASRTGKALTELPRNPRYIFPGLDLPMNQSTSGQ